MKKSAATSRLLRLLAALAACLCLGCFEGEESRKVAGGDDYPNGVEPLGKKAARTAADSADWNGFDSVPKSGPGLYDTVNVPDSVPDTAGAGKGAPAPKRAAAFARQAGPFLPADTGLGGILPKPDLLDTLVTRVLDTVKGTVEAVRTQVSEAGARQVDSLVFVRPDPARPGAAAGVTRAVRRVVSADSSRTDLWTFADADGDGFLTPRPGGRNLAAVEAVTALPEGLVRRSSQVLAAGADLDFNLRGDNRLLSSQVLVLRGQDTLVLVRFLDADGDSVLIDFAKDSNLVDLIEFRRLAEGGAAVSVTRQVRIVASRDSTRNYPIRFSERRVFSDGSLLDVATRGPGPDSAFRPGDEAHWTETRFHAAADSLERSLRAWKVRLGPVAGAFAANVLLGFTVEEDWRAAGPYLDYAFDFRCDTPVPDGKWIGDGEVLAWLTLADGFRAVFTGSAAAAGLEGRVTGSDGKSSAIAFDRAGAIAAPRP